MIPRPGPRAFRAALLLCVSLLCAFLPAAVLQGCFEGGGTETGNAGVIEGSLHDGGGTETGNSQVMLVAVEHGADGAATGATRTVRTDSRGRFAFPGVPGGRYAVFAPGAGETPERALATRLDLAEGGRLELPLVSRFAVDLEGRAFPPPGAAPASVRVCVPGMEACASVGADSVYRLRNAPVGAYELLFLSPGKAHYLAVAIDSAAAGTGTVHLRDVLLADSAAADHPAYAFYPLPGRALSLSVGPVAYAEGFAPAWYQGRRFDRVRYFLLSGTGPDRAWSGDWFGLWRHRLALSGDSLAGAADLAAPLPGFPLPVRLHAGNFDFAQAAPDGSDLAVSDGRGRLLSHHLERWDAAARRAEIWVRLDTLAARASGRALVLHWGRQGTPVGGLPDPGAVFRRADGFIGAWHLAESGGDSAVLDASSLFPGRLRGPLPAGGWASLRGEGLLAGAQRFGSGRNWINVTRQAGLDVSEAFTVAVWARLNPRDSARKQLLASKWAVNRREWHFHIHDSRSLELEFGDAAGTIQGAWRSVAPIADLDAWHHYAGVFDRGVVRLYVDGVEVPGVLATDVPDWRTGSIPPRVNTFGSDLNLGSNAIDHSLDLDGDLDEVWLAHEAKSSDWIRAAYESQKPRP